MEAFVQIEGDPRNRNVNHNLSAKGKRAIVLQPLALPLQNAIWTSLEIEAEAGESRTLVRNRCIALISPEAL